MWIILHTENPKATAKKLLEPTNEVNKVSEYKINTQKSVAFLHTKMNYQKYKLRNQFHLQLHKKNKIPRNIFNQGGEKPRK